MEVQQNQPTPKRQLSVCQSLPQQQAVGEVPQESAMCGGTQLMPTDTGAEGGFETLVKKGLILAKVITLNL